MPSCVTPPQVDTVRTGRSAIAGAPINGAVAAPNPSAPAPRNTARRFNRCFDLMSFMAAPIRPGIPELRSILTVRKDRAHRILEGTVDAGARDRHDAPVRPRAGDQETSI